MHPDLRDYGVIQLKEPLANLQLQNFLDYIPVGLRVTMQPMLADIMRSGPDQPSFIN